MTTINEIITRFLILLFIMPINFLKLALSHFKWVLEFLVYHPFYSLRFHPHHHQQHLQDQFQIFTEEEPVEIWHRREGEGEEVDCAVCLNKICEGDEVRVLRCEHVFHKDCLNQWVSLRNFTCPLCRDFVGSRYRVANDEGRQVHVLFFKFSSFSDNSDERDNWWLR